MDEQVWQKMSTEILTDIKEWRRANPRATYVQIEEGLYPLGGNEEKLMQQHLRIKCASGD